MGNFFSSRYSKEELTDYNLRYCNIYRFYRSRPNKTWLMGISSQEYEGIPENLVVNLVTTFILAIIFIVVRRSTGKHNYGRMSINIVEDLEPTDALHDEDVVVCNDAGPGVVAAGQNLSTQNTPSRIVAKEPHNEAENNIARPDSTHVAPQIIKLARKQENTTDLKDIGYFSWIRMVLTMPDRIYLEKCGADCVTYLSFQRHLILLAIFITGTSLLMILPMNMYLEKKVYSSDSGDTIIINKTKISGFAKLTIINLDENHAYCFWAHTILANAYVFLSIAVMKRFSKQVCILPEDSTVISTTICIIGLKQTQRQGGVIRTFFCTKFPDLEILEVSFAYNVSKLRKLEAERMRAQSAYEFYKKRHEAAIKSEGETQAERPKIRPYPLGIIGCCFGCKCWGICQCKKADAIDYYTAREASFHAKVEEERRHALSKPLGIAYVTFSSVEAAELVVDAFSRCCRRCANAKSSELNTVPWTVSFAPAPEEINWHNMSVNVAWWWIRCVLVNYFVILFVLTYSTPVAILDNWVPIFLNSRSQADNIWDKMAHSLLNTVPSLSVCILGSTLIIIVNQSDLLIGYWTKTAAHLSEMLKEYVFLFIMVCLLPGLGIQRLDSLWDNLDPNHLKCIFYPENGATFVKYVCTSSLCGIIVELIRIPTAFFYGVRIFFARSVAEKDAIRNEMVSEFPMGYSYARVILHFTLFSCYSVIYPLITPFGLLYFIGKHFVDRYHFYFSYKPCKVEKKIHSTAIYLLLFSLWLLHLNLFIYIIAFDIIRERDPSYVKDDNNYHLWAVKLFLMMGFCFTTAIYLGQRFCKVCIDFSSFQYSGKPNRVSDEKQSKEQKTVEGQSNETEFGDEDSKTRVTNGGPQSIHGSTYKMGAGTEVGRATEGTRRTVANNYVEGGEPFGRYIAPLLRPEFVRLAKSAPSRVESS